MVYLGSVAASTWLALASTGGQLTYALDDAYIHLAMARSLAEHGVWGVSPREFSAASSSLLWVLLLAAGRLLTESAWLPFGLNLACGLGILLVGNGLLMRLGVAPGLRATSLALTAFAAPMATLTLSGMEHLLHGLAALAFLRVLAGRPGRRPDPVQLAALAAVLGAVRLEGMFLVCAASAAVALRGAPLAGLATLLAGAAPTLVFGAISLANGSLWLANPILLKGAEGPLTAEPLGAAMRIALRGIENLYDSPALHLVAAATAVLLALEWRPGRRGGTETGSRPTPLLLTVFAASLVMHLLLARVGWLFRYEAYAVVVGVVLLTGAAGPWLSRLHAGIRGHGPGHGLLAAAAAGMVLIPLPLRGCLALVTAHRASANIHRQQVALADFFDAHYRGRTIALNDIGAVAYRARVDILDLAGLASVEVARRRLRGEFDAAWVAAEAERRGVAAAALYENWFVGTLPEHWLKVGTWTIPDNVVCADHTVTFFAPDAAGADLLRRRLTDHAVQLPAGVRQQLSRW